MRQDQSIDYSYHIIPLDRALKKAHDALLNQEPDDALSHLDELIFQARATRATVISMKEHNALRKQASSV